MPRTISHEALVSFVDEVRSYLPTMRQGIASYHADGSQLDALREATRLAHSVKGTASLVNLPGLAHVMSLEEDTLEAVGDGRHQWNDATCEFANGIVNLVETYCDDLLLKRADEAAFIASAAKLQRRLAGLDEAGDDVAIQEVVATVLPVDETTPPGSPRGLSGLCATSIENDADAATETSAEAVEPPGQARGRNDDDVFDPSVLMLNDQEQLDAFQLEAEDHLHDFATALAEYRRSPESLDPLRQARRTIHSLKGSASTIGLNDVAHLAHQMEDVLQQVLDGHLPQQDSTLELLQESTDRLEELVAQSSDVGRALLPVAPVAEASKSQSVGSEERPDASNNAATPSAAVPQPNCTTDFQSVAPIDGLQVRRTNADGQECPSSNSVAAAVVASKPAFDIDLTDRERVSADLLEVFNEEAEDHLKAIYAAFGRIEKGGAERDLIQDIRRAAHTLKGAAGAVGLRVVTQLSHRMEDLLDRLYEGQIAVTAEILMLLYNTTDTLQDLVSGKYDRDAMQVTISGHYAAYAELLEAPVGRATSPSVPTTVPNYVTANAQQHGRVDNPSYKDNDASSSNEIEVAALPSFGSKTVIAAAKAEENEAKADPRASRSGQVLRVPIERLDTLVRVVSELIINRTSFEQRMSDFKHFVGEMTLTIDRLKRVSQEMESRYGVTALGGRGLKNAAGDGAAAMANNFQINQARLDEFDALEFDRYTEFHLLSRSLAESTSDLNTVGGELKTLIGDFDSMLTRQGRLSRDCQDRLMRIRMVPVATLATRLHRTVRVVAQQQGKQVDLDIVGEHIELDKLLLEEMADPLLHILRNAADHGIEPPALRVVRGKPERATIRVKAFYQGTQVVLQISDDGNGLDVERIRQTAIANGLIAASQAETLSDEDLYQFIFLPGFSTAKEVSEVSGRGVGMDIVRSKVHALKGTIGVESEAGQGTTFTVRLPMTLAVTRALMVHAANETFAIPMQAVVQILRLERDSIEKLGREPIVRIGGKAHPLVKLSQQLRLKGTSDESTSTVPVLIVEAGGHQIALAVDKILSGRDIVVKTLGNHLWSVKGLIGATLMGDGSVVPILDPAELVGSSLGHVATVTPSRAAPVNRIKQHNDVPTIMIVDDSVSVRRVMTNLIKSAGWLPMEASNGIEALEKLQASAVKPDMFLLDIEMPRMDGYELLASLRSQDTHRSTPIVMVTSRAADKHRKKAIDLGATDYLIKPYQDEQLLSLIGKLVGAREMVGV